MWADPIKPRFDDALRNAERYLDAYLVLRRGTSASLRDNPTKLPPDSGQIPVMFVDAISWMEQQLLAASQDAARSGAQRSCFGQVKQDLTQGKNSSPSYLQAWRLISHGAKAWEVCGAASPIYEPMDASAAPPLVSEFNGFFFALPIVHTQAPAEYGFSYEEGIIAAALPVCLIEITSQWHDIDERSRSPYQAMDHDRDHCFTQGQAVAYRELTNLEQGGALAATTAELEAMRQRYLSRGHMATHEEMQLAPPESLSAHVYPKLYEQPELLAAPPGLEAALRARLDAWPKAVSNWLSFCSLLGRQSDERVEFLFSFIHENTLLSTVLPMFRGRLDDLASGPQHRCEQAERFDDAEQGFLPVLGVHQAVTCRQGYRPWALGWYRSRMGP